jgi:hypothetical protein
LAACLAPAVAQAQAAGPTSAEPPAASGRFSLTPGLQLETAAFLQGHSWFGQSQANIGAVSTNWAEAVVAPSLDWRYRPYDASSIYGRLSAIAAYTNGVDAAGSDAGSPQTYDLELEDGYVGWRSGDLFADTLGKDAIDVSFGRRKYQVGSGFLFWKESNNGASRGAEGIAPRKAARFAAEGNLSTHGWGVEGVYLDFNDRPSTHTRLAGAAVSYTSSAWGVAGVGVYKVLGSDKKNRDGMVVLNLRADLHPFTQLRGLRLAGEYVRQENGDRLSTDAGFVGIGYGFADAPWKPYVGYRRAIFRGDNPNTARSEAYDPFSLGISNWGSLLVGKYVLSNSNLRADALGLELQPLDRLKLTTELYRMSLDQTLMPIGKREFADEADLTAEWEATRRLKLSLMGAVAQPKAAARQITGGDRTWGYLVLDLRWAY